MKILLATLHAKYSHASLALPCLAAFSQNIPNTSIKICEWTTSEPREQLLRQIMAEQADVVAFSCYIWNIEKSLRIASDIKKVAPQTRIIFGGPEVCSNIFELMHDNPNIDFVIKGEGEAPFRQLISTLQEYDNSNLLERSLSEIESLYYRDGGDILLAKPAKCNLSLDKIPSPFTAGLVDMKKPLIYYETSRGCPFSCAFCLSSTEGKVRSFSFERIKSDLLFLMQSKVEQIKLVDRTFNYDAARANQIWEFILKHNQNSSFHFEISADLLTDDNFQCLKKIPAKMFRFEIGVQSASQETLQRVDRYANLELTFAKIRRLKAETAVTLHLDLIAGLPGDDYTGFLASIRSVAELLPEMIQIEPLKILKGSPMREIATRDDYHFSAFPPYTILRNPWLSFNDISRVETIGRLLDLFYNNGGFETAFKFLQNITDLASIVDRMARQAGNTNLSGFSNRKLYELFAELSAPLLDEAKRRMFYDALFFDYCMKEIPLMGKLPAFADEHKSTCSWPGLRDLPAELKPAPNSRIKVFKSKFLRDYREDEWKVFDTVTTFLYISGEGRGLQVSVL